MNNIHANPVEIIKKDIYVIKNDINDKVYVGQALNTLQRFKNHCKPNKDNLLIDAAIRKYGQEHFWYEILESQIENYNEREKYWIKKLNSKNPNGYNILDGGEEPPRNFGEDNVNCTISDEIVKMIKDDLRNTTLSLQKIADKYNISKRAILHINQGASRSTIGESYPIRKNPNPIGKLTDEDIEEIIYLLKYSYRFNGEIARQFGVEVHAINRINQGLTHHKDNIEYPIRKWKSSGTVLFTYEQVTEIINLLQNTNQSINSIAKQYNVTFHSIQDINTGNSKKYKRDNLQYPLRPF